MSMNQLSTAALGEIAARSTIYEQGIFLPGH